MRTLIRPLLAVFALVALAGITSGAAWAVAVTPTPADHAGHHTATATPATGQMGGMMMGTPGAGMPMSEPFDLLFIDMMIPHHESAVLMAHVAVDKGQHKEVRDLAQAIITTQQAEIDQLKAWRQQWYPNAASMSMDQMTQLMNGLEQGMPGMMGTPAMHGQMGTPAMGGMSEMMDPAAEAAALENAKGPFDRAFLEMMIPHHQSAVIMAQVALQRATHPEIKQLAQTIISGQEHEITEMQSWLSAWYGAGTPAAVVEVKVTLSEFTIRASQTSFQAGQTYRFVVTNGGTIPHEFMVMPSIKGMDRMPMDELDDVALAMIPADELSPGTTRTIDVRFGEPTDDLSFVCAVTGHVDAGMTLPVDVGA